MTTTTNNTSPLLVLFSIISFLVGLGGLIVGSIALSHIGTINNDDNISSSSSSQSVGLTSVEDFVGVWEALGYTTVLTGAYNASAEDIEVRYSTGSLTHIISSVDAEGRFEGIRCPSTISAGTNIPAPMGGVIGNDKLDAQASIYFRNNEATPSNRFGFWRWRFIDDSNAILYLENQVNIPTQDARAFTGSSTTKKVSTDPVCPT